ncbi:ABC transporter substrate-binding protein [Paenibacillus sp. GCM10027626]|uniref:ABC transporter substrate-binding protein n=1 Tax=Paenibacillus sp. GCM10027626 TaxID=3273411 RepID=UPI00362CB301
MNRKGSKVLNFGIMLVVFMLVIAGCGAKAGNEAPANTGSGTGNGQQQPNDGEAGQAENKPLTKVKLVLDWAPNTNHTGLYVARDNGFFKNHGLDVEIILPGDAGSDKMVATGAAEFGVSYQEGVTQARIQGVPIVSLAAVIQHNTSGFASPVEKNIKTPKDFEGKTYGGWGSPAEEAIIESLMSEQGADASKVTNVSIGDVDFFTAVKRNIDFAWIYYAWTGVEAELRGEKLNMVYLTDYSDKLDYYTPVLTTSEKMIADNKALVEAFVAGAAEGYQFAIEHPEDAAEVLIKAEPDLNADLVRASQKWLSPKYQDDAPRWGEQKREVWENYAKWMLDHKLLEQELDVDKAFTNEFLPQG